MFVLLLLLVCSAEILSLRRWLRRLLPPTRHQVRVHDECNRYIRERSIQKSNRSFRPHHSPFAPFVFNMLSAASWRAAAASTSTARTGINNRIAQDVGTATSVRSLSTSSTKPPSSSSSYWRQLATFAVAGVVGFGSVYVLRSYMFTETDVVNTDVSTATKGGPGNTCITRLLSRSLWCKGNERNVC